MRQSPYLDTASAHAAADAACGREWQCACAACRAVREQVNASRVRLWIIGNGATARWHLGECRKSKYGGSEVYIARCTGRQIYGPFGIGTRNCVRPPEFENVVCKRCDRLLGREAKP